MWQSPFSLAMQRTAARITPTVSESTCVLFRIEFIAPLAKRWPEKRGRSKSKNIPRIAITNEKDRN
jgi:hypothetical protein